MSEVNYTALAKEVYQTLCSAIERREWNYEKDDEMLAVKFAVVGKDLPMDFVIVVDAERQLVRVLSPLSFKMSEEKRMEGAIAACAASFGLLDGSFDYDIADGTVVFRQTASFRESAIGEGLFQYMISLSCTVVDEFNDKFQAINEGRLSIAEFIKNRRG